MTDSAMSTARRVVIDAQIFQIQRRGGVSRYFADLARELDQRPDVDLALPFRRIRNDHLPAALPGRFTTIGGSRLLTPRVMDLLDVRRRSAVGTADIVHHTWYRPEALAQHRARRRICTVHDMIPEEFPEIYAHRDPHHGKREHVDAADAVACNSEATRADLVRHWGDLGKPVHVTHLAVADSFFHPSPDQGPPPVRYVLFVGRRPEYKNFDVLARAFEALGSRHPDLHLVCVGGGPLSAAESEGFERRGLVDRVHQVDVPEADLPSYYARAECFVFPSRYEGFGLPVLEAFASGTPVVVSHIPSLLEVAGGQARSVDPDQPDDVAAAIEDVLAATPDQRSATITAGRDRAREFTWRRTCESTLALYDAALAT